MFPISSSLYLPTSQSEFFYFSPIPFSIVLLAFKIVEQFKLELECFSFLLTLLVVCVCVAINHGMGIDACVIQMDSVLERVSFQLIVKIHSFFTHTIPASIKIGFFSV